MSLYETSAFGSSTSMVASSGHHKSSSGDKMNDSGASKKKSKSFRIEVALFEPTADSFPEFNFRHLLDLEKVGIKLLL